MNAALGIQDNFLRDQAGLCVACGLCLPGCPTYRETRDEAESPRGRLSLMRALASAELEPSEKLVAHLEHCLACRACERACPSNVPYGRLLDDAREKLGPARLHHGFLHRALLAMLASPSRRRLLDNLLRLARRTGLQRLAQTSGILGRNRLTELAASAGSGLPRISWQPLYTARTTRRGEAAGAPSVARGPRLDPIGEVALFTGCVTDLLEREAMMGAIAILNHLGYDVHVPKGQTCCGALYRQSGDSEKARALMNRNLEAFSDKRYTAILSIASGCSARLSEYEEDSHAGATVASRFRDITGFLADAEWPAGLMLQPLAARIAVHDACLQRNVLREEQSTYRLLRRIPGANISPLPENHLCCGAGGGYFLDHPDMARKLRAPKLVALKTLAPDLLVTSNTGCAMHLRAGLRESGQDLEVLHPVSLLARQFRLAGGEQTGLR
jgi:glycolate oxidase iron-sulfur subunit